MTISHFPEAGYIPLPWKNGLGTTDEVCLLPEGATRDAFGLRISRATIAEPGQFSVFPGVERVITLISAGTLTLDFGDTVQRLQPRSPYRFDSARMPVGDPHGGVVQVLNVMAATADWRISRAEVLEAAADLDTTPGAACIMFAISGEWIASDGDSNVLLGENDTALVVDAAHLAPARAGHGAVLLVGLEPLESRR